MTRERKRRRVDWAIVALLTIAAFAISSQAMGQPPSGVVHPRHQPGQSKLDLGAQLYAGNCSSCHGVDGSGVNPPRPGAGNIQGAGPDLRGVGSLASDFYLRTGRMPLSYPSQQPERGRPDFSNREIAAINAYIASLGKGPSIPHPRPGRGSLASGLQLFTEHCAGCHQVVGQGGYVTGARVPVLDHATNRQIAEAVRIGPYLMPRFSRRAIDRRQLDDIVAYVDSIRAPDDPGGLGIGHIGPVPEGIVAWLIAGVALVGVCVLIGERMRT